ncbi:hypothetical protein EVA_03032 [gut metagenome]|uniref:Uncharacterized protein n=1 Tax=gut metagenome TaxID=749906 RepID=J9GZU6_9ZZZZ
MKTIGQSLLEMTRTNDISIDGRTSQKIVGTQIIQTTYMIVMFMRQQHRPEKAKAKLQHLLTEIRSAVNQYIVTAIGFH